MIDQSLARVDEKGNEKVECMECHQAGTPRFFHTLVVHLKNVHGMNEGAYRTKWKTPTVSAWMTGKMRAAVAKEEPPPPPKKTTITEVIKEQLGPVAEHPAVAAVAETTGQLTDLGAYE